MLQALVRTASRLLKDWTRRLYPEPVASAPRPAAVSGARTYQPLQRLLLTDGVGRTLFEEFAAHRNSPRGEEETGWVLLGLRETSEAVVLATLPAGAERSASVSHVCFNSSGQVLGSRIVRQRDRRLTILGVVHTHPGSLRHPSDGDYRGDSLWVGHLRGGEGIFGIGTADGEPAADAMVGRQPKPHVQRWGELCLSWYTLKEGDPRYRPLPVGLTLGPDLARPLHSLWPTIEGHAERLDRLCRQQAGVTFEVVSGQDGPALAATVPLAEPGDAIRLLIEGKEARYYWIRQGEALAVDPGDTAVDHGVYLLLAELAARY